MRVLNKYPTHLLDRGYITDVKECLLRSRPNPSAIDCRNYFTTSLCCHALPIASLCLSALIGCAGKDGADNGSGGAAGNRSVTVAGANAGGATGGVAAGGVAAGGTAGGRGGTAGAFGNGGAPGTSGSGGASSAGSAGMPSGGAAVSDDLCDAGVSDGSAPEVLSLSGSTGVHDPTMIEADGVFYRFWTGRNIPMATSSNLTSWQNGASVYTNGYPAWVATWLDGVPDETFNFPWAPDVSRFSDRFHIYSSFSAIFGDNVSCITHLSTGSIAQGGWTDHGPVICTTGSERYNAIDADVGIDTSGTAWLAFGSFWDGIMAFPLNPDGSRAGTDLTLLAWANEIEAPVLFRRCGYYYLFVSWGLCCPGEGRTVEDLTYRVAVGRSQNIMGPYLDRDGTSMVQGGGTLVVQGDGGTWAAAGHGDVIVRGNKIYHLYHAYPRSGGGSQLRIAELLFDSQGWPVSHAP
jgi:arabinan endo-1,5-alpha-L-arabinosidase